MLAFLKLEIMAAPSDIAIVSCEPVDYSYNSAMRFNVGLPSSSQLLGCTSSTPVAQSRHAGVDEMMRDARQSETLKLLRGTRSPYSHTLYINAHLAFA